MNTYALFQAGLHANSGTGEKKILDRIWQSRLTLADRLGLIVATCVLVGVSAPCVALLIGADLLDDTRLVSAMFGWVLYAELLCAVPSWALFRAIAFASQKLHRRHDRREG